MAALAWACTPAPFVKRPPERYRHTGVFLVETHPTAELPSVCAGGSTVGEGSGTVVGCFKGAAVHLPNPCEWPDDPWAEIACHEFGHAQGWPGNHRR